MSIVIGSGVMEKRPANAKPKIGRSILGALLAFAIWPAVATAETPVIGSADPACATTPLAAVPAMHVTHGSIVTRSGRSIDYDAVAGWERVGGDDVIDRLLTGDGEASRAVPQGSPAALMSYVAYFAKGAPSTGRPIMFVWDGGPGSSTRPMLLGSFGPVIEEPLRPVGVATGPKGPPVRPDPDTLLDVTDLVFVDAPGTGFGHLEGCAPEHSFYGIDVDAAAFQRFIRRFLSTYHREPSPLFLFGESYGTTRAAVVARRLEQSGKRVSGVILLSQLLAFDAWSDGSRANPGTENAFFLTLPSFAATAWAHNRVPHDGDLESWLRGVERFSMNEYAPALLQGTDLPPERKRALAERLAAYTGLSTQTWLDANLRIEGTRFRNSLEADQGKIVGREDTRLDGPVPKVKGTAVEDDPTLKLWRAPRLAAFDSYERGTLQLGDRPYISGIDVPWDMHHQTDPAAWPDTYVNAGPDLVAAMEANTQMHVLVVGGYFDLAAPYLGGPYLIKHLEMPDALRTNLTWREYPGGHSAYTDDANRRDMHNQIANLVIR